MSASPGGCPHLLISPMQKFPDALPVKHPGQSFCETAACRNNCETKALDI